jgi:hypothetical protein
MESRVGYGGIPLDTPPLAVGSFIFCWPWPSSQGSLAFKWNFGCLTFGSKKPVHPVNEYGKEFI